MSKLRMLKSLVNERLSAAAEEIFGIFETTFEEYECEVFRAKQEIDCQRKLLDLVLKPEIKLCRLRADHLKLPVYEEEVHPEQQERSPSLGQEEPELLQIEEDEEERIKQQEEASGSRLILQPIKCENKEENTQWSELSQTLKEENREGDHLPSTSSDQMVIEADGEDCGVSERASDIEPARDGQLLSSDCSGTEMEDSEVHPEQQERSTSLGKEELELLQIKEEQENLIQQQEEASGSRLTLQPIKCENEEENTQSTQLSQTFKEENGEADPLPSTSSDQMNTEPDGEDCGVSEPASDVEPDRDGQLLSSDCSGTETEDSDDYFNVNERLNVAAKEKYNLQLHVCDEEFHPEQDCGVSEPVSGTQPARDGQLLSSDGSGTETEEGDDYCKDAREPWSGVNSLKSKKTQKGQMSYTSKKLKRSTESLHEFESTNHIASTSCCKVCGESFPNIVSLMRHIEVHSNQCGLCEKHLEPTESLACHLQMKCDVSGKGFPKELALERHLGIHTGDKPFGCTECGRRFYRRENLNLTGEKPFSCSVCNKSFRNKSYLKIHMRGHTGEKPFKCSFCNRSFGHKSNMIMHMKSHTGERPYSCSVCNKGFGRKYTMERHMRGHRFNQKEHLTAHMISDTGEKPFSCSICNNSFGRKSTLKRHMRGHTGDKPFRCTECGKRFTRKEYMTAHMMSHTGRHPLANPIVTKDLCGSHI